MLTKLTLQNFRNYSNRAFKFDSQTTLIVGPNAIGKTNILEAIDYLATGKSLRAGEEKEVIKDGETLGRLVGEVGDTQLEIIWDNRERFHKIYQVNGVGKRQVDFVGHLITVLFQPTDIEIVIGSPSERRKYLDNVLSQTHKDYRLAHHLYEKGLRQRNRILWRAKKDSLPSSVYRPQLEYWDELLITNGKIIHDYRQKYLDFVNLKKNDFFEVIVEYDHSIISETRLEKYRQEEALAGTTLVGPHRDEVIIRFKSKSKFKFTRELAHFGSRGEQRLGVFALKIAEVDYVELVAGQRPLLLLDDIFSELDKENRRHILEFIRRQQTIMTTTDIHQNEEDILTKIGATEIRLGS